MEKDCKNYLAKVVGKNKDDKDIVEIYCLLFKDNKLEYEKADIEPLDWDIAKKQFSVLGMIG